MTRTLSITITENNYHDLKKIVGSRQISKFVNQAVAKELEQKKQELITAYKSSAKSKKIQQEAGI
jgi:predicted CopG family antitoxin